MPRWTVRAVLLFISLMLARQAWLAMYVHPYADDFNYAAVGMQHDLLPRLAVEREVWNGRWASNPLMLRGPMVLGPGRGLPLYRTVPVLLVLASIAALMVLLRRVVRASRRDLAWWAAGAMVLYLHLMPDLGQGIHWYTGAVTYQLGAVLLLVHGAAVIDVHRNGPRVPTLLVAVVALLVAGGFNEVNAVLLVALHAALCLWPPRGSRAVPHVRWALLLIALGGLWYVAAAPGNAVRGAGFPARHDPFLTLAWSTAQTGRFLLRWAFDPAVLLATLLMLHVLRRRPGPVPPLPYGRWPLTAALVAMVWVVMVLPYWSTGLLGQHRTVNVACFLFLPLWAAVVIAWDREVFRPRGWRLPGMAARHRPLAGALLVLCLLLTGNDARVNADLFSGRAARYDRQMMERYDRVYAAVRNGAQEVAVPPLHDPPRSLAPLDLRTDPHHWINAGMAAWAGDPALRIVRRP
ncbi:MAG: DUF6056 family protein [Flavobacteriales bacterium]|jgi:hypothetical protein|nr:DUF6056 family protein [Flavobacteriales bacterium]